MFVEVGTWWKQTKDVLNIGNNWQVVKSIHRNIPYSIPEELVCVYMQQYSADRKIAIGGPSKRFEGNTFLENFVEVK
jgi:hypothetical protein